MGDGPCVCGKSLIDRSDSSRSMMVDSDRSSSNCSHNSTTNTFTFDADEEYDSPTKVELLPGATHSCGGLHSSTSSPEKDAQHKYSSLSSNDNDERKSIAEVMKLEPDDPGVVFLLNNSQIIHNICNLPHSPVAGLSRRRFCVLRCLLLSHFFLLLIFRSTQLIQTPLMSLTKTL
eukprot:c5822_g1_i1.p1 GENE.c5822_g1_i1~~c5822_g1_i1.p1  ORF type:complete len:175 (-),score=21.25 c5822_g1_i1:314-838(-)